MLVHFPRLKGVQNKGIQSIIWQKKFRSQSFPLHSRPFFLPGPHFFVPMYLSRRMDILIRQARLTDPAAPLHGQAVDIAIRNGIIQEIAPTLSLRADQVIEAAGHDVSPGFVDLFAHFCDPGEEHRETIESGAAAAAAGGYTDVLVVPNTQPCTHSKSTVEYLLEKSRRTAVNLHPIGALTRNTEGKELAELYDMHASGTRAFSDGWKPVQSGGLLVKALQYVLPIDATIIQLPDDRSFNPGGLMHEGVVSTQLGLPGRPSMAEELMVARDIELLRYTGSKLHLTGISTAGSLERIRRAKQERLRVSCSVTPYHLLFTDEDLRGYDTYLKVNPPLRTAADRDALRTGVADGTIDCIASHHLPQDSDHKIIEFEYAAFGMIGLQTAFAAVCTALPQLGSEKLAALFGGNARQLFGLPGGRIATGEPAALTLFRPGHPFAFSALHNKSRSANSPFLNQSLTGSITGTIHKGSVFLNTI